VVGVELGWVVVALERVVAGQVGMVMVGVGWVGALVVARAVEGVGWVALVASAVATLASLARLALLAAAGLGREVGEVAAAMGATEAWLRAQARRAACQSLLPATAL
jgi:hypothetical protein